VEVEHNGKWVCWNGGSGGGDGGTANHQVLQVEVQETLQVQHQVKEIMVVVDGTSRVFIGGGGGGGAGAVGGNGNTAGSGGNGGAWYSFFNNRFFSNKSRWRWWRNRKC
jgi:hypothetical protein